VYELVVAGGWLMLPLLGCSVLVVVIAVERLLALRPERVVPSHLLTEVWQWVSQQQMNGDRLRELRRSSPLGQVLATALTNAHQGRAVMKDSVEESAGQATHELERFVGVLGTIAAIAPLIGLLGTVFGMIEVFTAMVEVGSGNAALFADGIAKALITTAAGLMVAIPALICHRYFERHIDGLAVAMEEQAIRLVDAMHGERQAPGAER
jgi:biopolymer transport protein ExbB